MPVIGFHASHEQIDPARCWTQCRLRRRRVSERRCARITLRPGARGRAIRVRLVLAGCSAAGDVSFLRCGQRARAALPPRSSHRQRPLAQMFPGRFWVALGSGEAMNEHITGERWPAKSVRNARLRECVDIMRALFAGETVSHHGLVQVDRARLWTVPEKPPPFLGAAVSEATAAWVGSWADGLVTINQPTEKLERMIRAFRENGGEGKPLFLQIHVAYGRDEEAALGIAYDQWRTNVFPPSICWDLELPEMFEDAARFVRPEDLMGPVLISAEAEQFVDWLAEFAELGFERIYVHHVGKEQRAFIDVFGERVLPTFAGSAS